jgi:hypothetical protein
MNVLRNLLSGLLLCSCSLQATSGYVVIASTAASIKLGAMIGDGESVELGVTQKLKLISAGGRLVSLIGPYEGEIKASLEENISKQGLLTSLAKLVEAAHTSELTMAVSRNTQYGGEKPRGDIWGADISEPGNYCIRADQRLLIWWSDAVVGASIRLENETLSETLDMRWKSRGNQRWWPREISINDNNAYSATIDLSAKQ